MKQKNFNLFTQTVILNASQMAYLEDAKKTQTMLLRFNELFRYFIKSDSPVILSEEINGLKNYVDIQLMRYGDRFSVEFPEEEICDHILVNHLEVIDFFDNILNNALAQYENSIRVAIKIETKSIVRLMIFLYSDNNYEEFSIVLMEEGRSFV